MHMLDQWEQVALFDPANPTQKKIEKYAGIPGQYASYYYNRVPVQGQLKGPFTSSVTQGAGIAVGFILVSLGLGATAWALQKTGIVKRRHSSKPVSGLGLFHYKRRRRRRR